MYSTTSDEEIKLNQSHDKICQTCDGCSRTRCSFTEGYWRGHKETIESFGLSKNTVDDILNNLAHEAGQRGDNEGAAECLNRIIAERDMLLRREINRMFGKP